MILDITYMIPERHTPHRWLSIYAVAMNLDRLWGALAIFYYSVYQGKTKVIIFT